MKQSLVIMTLAAALAAPAVQAADYVSGYTRSDGTYVQPHYRSSPDSSKWNNYSTKGNTNPYTGQRGSQSPYSGFGSSSNRSSGSYGNYGYGR